MNRRAFAVIAVLVALGWPVWAFAAGIGDGATTPPSAMSDYTLYALIAGAALTYVAAAINRSHWPDHLRFATFFAFSLVAAGLDAYFTRSLDWHNWVRALLLVVGSGITFYNLNRGAIKSFEAATS